MAVKLTDIEISSSEMAELLDLNGKSIYQLTRAGILSRGGGDRLKLERSIRQYVRYLRAGADQTRVA